MGFCFFCAFRRRRNAQKKKKYAGGDTPHAPRQGVRPLHSRLKGGYKKPTRETPPGPPAGAAPLVTPLLMLLSKRLAMV